VKPALGQEHIIGWMSLTDAQVVHLPLSRIEGQFVKRLHKSTFLVHGSNLNTAEEIQEGLKWGIDQFSTDNLELALNIRKEL
jgi:hypothetical protein